jgi:hypothetical protein
LEEHFPKGVNSKFRGVASVATPVSMKDIGINGSHFQRADHKKKFHLLEL